MNTRTLTHIALLLAAGLAATMAAPGAARADQLAGIEAGSPEAWSPQDPADSLFRAARDAMNRGDYVRAADLFRQVWERNPRSAYAPDAPYWEAFNRYRSGETRDLERALASLAEQERRWANAPTRQAGDAAELATRINGMLARRGDAGSAGVILEQARIAAEVGRAVTAESRAIVEATRAATEAGRAAAALAVTRAGSRPEEVPPQCREQVDVQVAALNALLQMNAETALPILAQVMARRDECSPPIRRRAVFMVANTGGAQAVDLLLAATRNDPDMEVRRQAVFWLSQVRDERAIAVLAEFAMQPGDDQLRERAVFGLAQHRDPRAREVLRRIAQDASAPSKLRSHAVFWLGNEGPAEDLAFLRGLFGRTGDAALDERILFAAGQARGRDNVRWLLAVAGDDRIPVEMRRKAVFWAGEAGAPAGELGALYDRTADRDMKERVLFALSQSRQDDAIERLIHITRNERDARLRSRAIFWLGNSADPRAAAALAEILAGGTD